MTASNYLMMTTSSYLNYVLDQPDDLRCDLPDDVLDGGFVRDEQALVPGLLHEDTVVDPDQATLLHLQAEPGTENLCWNYVNKY